ncbi:type II CRISPR RNA-guided endonuclease Cas9 [Tannockella kyphosi]|uniref:type II CRISPR RNA-guided endonuclease Cas9 n=1 Tax=Tannockella kyphosi TaxID=2899121 RepID=UPI002012949A|nr:type II CRISPR RNA-guided endonuclease Cas9 [Tannockella kyphosi]
MVKKKKIIYTIGIDIGTNSVGWAVVDEYHKLVRFKRENMWGTRLFETANVAKERRLSRGTRRKFNKRRERIRWLDYFFMGEVIKVDPLFIKKIKEASFLDYEDKKELLGTNIPVNLFNSQEEERDYFKMYPTVYHLRKALMTVEEKMDPRYVYLALHHIIKYRGNFLYEGQEFNANNIEIEDKLMDLFSQMQVIYGENESISQEEIDLIKIILSSTSMNATAKKKEIVAKVKWQNSKRMENIFSVILGLKIKLTKLFEIKDIDDKVVLHFKNEEYTEKLADYESELGEKMEFIALLHEIYSWIVLEDVLQSEESISDAMISKYETHKQDLKVLKKLINNYDRDEFIRIFKDKDEKTKSYYNYINHPKKCSQEDLNKKILEILNKLEGEEVELLKKRATEDKLLPKINSTDNGAIPYQLHVQELKTIIEKQEKYYPTIKENKDKLLKLVTFRYPYYIGPMSYAKVRKFAWLTKRPGQENQRITPWNIEEVVNMEETAAAFINRMRNTCTYFPGEYTLAKNSLYVSKYEVLNELNQIRVDDKLLPVEVKTKAFEELFMKKIIVKEKDFIEWYENGQYKQKISKVTGYQKEKQFASSLAPWIKFTQIFGEINDDNIDDIEKIILWMTVYEDKKILKKRIQLELPEFVNEEQLTSILSTRYSGWSSLSKKILSDIKSEGKSVLDILESEQLVFQQVITSSKYQFKKHIADAVKLKDENDIVYEDIAALHGSPSLKRGIWQAVKVVKEIIQVMGCEPENIFLEIAREENTKKRTVSRKDRLDALYKEIASDKSFDSAYIDSAKSIKKQLESFDDKQLRNDKLYLYCLQLGRCMYSGETLSLSSLQEYEIDHVLPRCLVPDNSIDNLVLVKRKRNQEKSDQLCLDPEIIQKQRRYWQLLQDRKLISSKKQFNLSRPEFDKAQIEGFIARQLVETRQITKHVLQLLQNRYPEVNVSAIRANLSKEFTNKYGIVKVRGINDYHHAHDAYTAAFLGGYIKMRYPMFGIDMTFNKYRNKRNKDLEYGIHDKGTVIINSLEREFFDSETGELIWKPNNITSILKVYDYKKYFLTKKVEENKGIMFNLTVLSKSNNLKTKAKIPVNKNRANVEKYGGFSGIQSAYCMGIKFNHNKNKKEDTKIISVPIYLRSSSEEELISYLEKEYSIFNVSFITGKIYIQQLILYKGHPFYLTSHREIVNAQQLILDKSTKTLFSKMEKCKKSNSYSVLQDEELLEAYDILLTKGKQFYSFYDNELNKIEKGKDLFLKLSLEDKVTVLFEILKIYKAGAENGNLKLIGGTEREGRRPGLNLRVEDLLFINSSITGMYHKR